MARFEQLNKNLLDLLLSIIENQQLCRLIANEPDVENPDELLFKKIFPFPKLPEPSEVRSTYLNIYFSNFKLSRSNEAVKSGKITFDVISHLDLWKIPNSMMLRPLAILHEIDSMINQQRIVGIKKAEFNECSPLFINSSYVGYRLIYDIVSGN